MPAKFTNNASAPLAASINTTSASITVTTSYGAFFPSLGAGEYFYATLTNSSNAIEIVKVTARSGDTLTAVRGQEGTTALSWAAADKIELRITAADLANFAQFDAVNAFTGNNTFSGTSTFSNTSTFSGAVALPAAPTFGGGALGVLSGGTGATTAAAAAAIFAAEFGKLLFPIGSIYTNASNATNPATLLGFGTWVAFAAGRMPIGNGSNGTNTFVAGGTGGATFTAITTANLPSHSHTATVYDPTHSHGYYSPMGGYTLSGSGGTGSDYANTAAAYTGISVSIGATGSGVGLQTISPYIVVYMWQRTA